MHRRLCYSAALLALSSFALAGCGSGAPSTQPGQTVPLASITAEPAPAGATDAVALAEGRRTTLGSAREDEHEISASPKILAFKSSRPQTVDVLVKDATWVFAGSSDADVASVSPSEQRVRDRWGGTLQFTVTPHMDHQRAALICFVTRDWRYACVVALVGNATPTPTPASPSPSPSPSPMASPTTTAKPTATATQTAPPTASPSPSPSPTASPTPSPTGNGMFTFNPPSPEEVNTIVRNQNPPYVTVTESEGGYTGSFSFASCSTATAGATCTVSADHQSAQCFLNGGAQGLELLQENGYFEVAPIGPGGTESCSFVISDQQGHTATYVVNLD